MNQEIVLNSALSVTVNGHLVTLARDIENKRATVRVMTSKPLLTKAERVYLEDVSTVLMKRAQRFLGQEWNVTRQAL